MLTEYINRWILNIKSNQNKKEAKASFLLNI